MNAPVDYRNTYRDQLDRVRRFLARMQREADQAEFQDMAWSFFQHCWHLKDWINSDRVLVNDAQRRPINAAAHVAGSPLRLCQDLCNGTKHLGSRPGARQHHMAYTLFAWARRSEMDCIIDDGHGHLISGKQLAAECVAEWERILRAQGLSIDPVKA
jgi:hypothetical protein